MNAIIVSDVRLYREGLKEVLNRDGRVRVLGTASDTTAAVALVESQVPATVMLDISTPGALDTIEAVAQRAPATKVIALGLSETASDVLACVEAGIAGYVSRNGSIDDLVQSAIDAVNGRFACSDRIAATLAERVHSLASDQPPAASALTPRERQVVGLLREGLTNKEISTRLCIEVATVKNHVHNVLEKLGAASRSEAARIVDAGRELRYRRASSLR